MPKAKQKKEAKPKTRKLVECKMCFKQVPETATKYIKDGPMDGPCCVKHEGVVTPEERKRMAVEAMKAGELGDLVEASK